MHEIGHGLGIISYRNSNTGVLPNYEMVFDKYTVVNPDGSVSFVGPNAESVYGGLVSVTTLNNGEQYSHFGNSISEPDGRDLMNGVEFDYGTRYNISNLDIAVMKDLGFLVGTQPPAAPASLADAAVVNGHVSAANDTATQALTGTAEANSTVTVYDNGTALAHTATADINGRWSYTLGQLSAGAHSLTATATDAAGNTSAASAALAFTVDTSGGGSGGGSTNASLFGTVTADPHSAGGEVYALFEGILGRAPDASGLEYYANQIAHGVAPASLAANFLASPEGQARLGAADNTAFIQQLYQNTLHRAADASGLQYHLDELAHGASRVQVADNFVFSPEFTNTVQQAISSGLFVPDANASEVARLYYTMLGRAPDANGLAYWTDKLAHGGSASDLAQGFLNSPENQTTYGKLSNSAYVDALYVNALGRHAESDGLSYWTSHLDQGESRADLAVQLSQSPEAQSFHLAQIEQGWHLA
ncbi:DUF4214 domain-containing protein [Methylobacterium sp. P31]